MQLLRAQIKNLFSIEEADVDLKDLGLTMVTGHSYDEGSANGAGKSSLARNSLLWGLYGLSGSAKGDAVVNRHEGKKAEIRIDFIGVDGHQYQIHRTRKPNNLTLTSCSSGDPLNQNMTRRNEKDTQEVINQLLGRTYNIFTQTDVFGQGKKKVFCDLTASEQKETIESILPMENLAMWGERVKGHKKDLLKELAELEQGYAAAFSKQQTLEQQLEKLKNAADFWEKVKKKKLNGLQHDLNREENLELDNQERIEQLREEIASTYVTGRCEELGTLEANLLPIEAGIVKNTQEQAQLMDKMQAERAETSECPECNQPIQPDLSDDLRKFDVLKADQKQQQLIHQSIKGEIGAIKRILQLKIRESRKGDILTEIDTLNSTHNPHSGLVQETTNDIKSAKYEVDAHVRAGQHLREEEKRLDFWVQAFTKDLQILLFQRACPFLEERANFYLNELGNSQIRVKVDTTKTLKSGETRDEFNVSVASNTGGEVFSLLSGGEQQMVNFSVSLALSDLAETQAQGASQFTILDEPFTNLDARNSENVVSFLTGHLSTRKSTILLISNEDNLKGLIPNRIHVEKKNGRTRIAG
jgi:DNA repair exonuclease SbcCD ATPase subunit